MSEQDENDIETVEDIKELERKWIRQYNMTEEQIAGRYYIICNILYCILYYMRNHLVS